MILANLGVVIFFFNLITLILFLLILIPAMILRIIIEEKNLFRIGGYVEFAQNRQRLIPGIW
jgi:protein-S-isoprenylcysteine O-methyltransferase Ste14